MENNVWKSFLRSHRTAQEKVELTSAITNRMLRYGIGNRQGYNVEKKVLDLLYENLPIGLEVRKGFEAFKIFVPKVPEQIFNRYLAIRHEINNTNIDSLVIAACGLSPLGITNASENPNLDVYESDLSDIIEYRRNILPDHDNYHLFEWNLFSERPDFLNKIKGKTCIVIEGLFFYLKDEQKHNLNKRLQETFKKDTTYIFDMYIADISSKEKDTVLMPEHPEWKNFINLVSNVFDGQKSFLKTRNEVISYFRSEGFENVRASQISYKGNAHTIFVMKT